jgi:D-methionine transport system ATP-binding protein
VRRPEYNCRFSKNKKAVGTSEPLRQDAARQGQTARIFSMIDILSVSQQFPGSHGPVDAVREVSLRIGRGEIFGIIGRSGAGKSSLVRTINLLNRPRSGKVIVGGRDLTALSQAQLREARRDIGLIFQHFNLLSSRTVAQNVALPLELAGVPAAEIRKRVDELLDLVGLDALRDRYPAQISGGQKQRVGIARAVATRPAFVVLDEPTSALDMSLRVSLLGLLKELQSELGVAYLFITHDLSTVRQLADRVLVMHRGRVVESGTVDAVLDAPADPYTQALIAAIPVPDPSRRQRPQAATT